MARILVAASRQDSNTGRRRVPPRFTRLKIFPIPSEQTNIQSTSKMPSVQSLPVLTAVDENKRPGAPTENNGAKKPRLDVNAVVLPQPSASTELTNENLQKTIDTLTKTLQDKEKIIRDQDAFIQASAVTLHQTVTAIALDIHHCLHHIPLDPVCCLLNEWSNWLDRNDDASLWEGAARRILLQAKDFVGATARTVYAVHERAIFLSAMVSSVTVEEPSQTVVDSKVEETIDVGTK